MPHKSVVAIGIPSGDMVHTDFAMALAMLCMNAPTQTILLNSRSSLVPMGRNQCVGAAQIMKATHLLFLDTDMIFPADALHQLLVHNKDIVGATYSARMPPFDPLTVTEEGAAYAHAAPGLQRVRLLPTGCMLIHMRVFNALAQPFFNMIYDQNQLYGEGYYFCQNARAAGFDLWCDGDLSTQIGHVGQKIYRIAE